MTPDKPVITTKGLNDIGVTLNLAYPGRSWQEVVLANTRSQLMESLPRTVTQ
jgi:hypothetical protein